MATKTGEELKRDKANIDRIGYNTKETEYFHYLCQRLFHARDARDRSHPQFDGMTYLQYLENNERLWNSYIAPKSDPRDWRSRARKRTVFQKGQAILGKIMEENFGSEFTAYDENSDIQHELGKAMGDAVHRTKEMENSTEKEYLIGMELLKHGNVAVQETFEISDRVIKELDHVNWEIGSAPDKQKWKEKTIPYRRDCVKNLVRLDSVYLGDISQFDLTKQNYVFIRTYKQYEEAKAIFGNWKRWEFVKPGRGGQSMTQERDRIAYLDQWRLGDLEENEVEIIEYMDKWNDEYQIIINGVMMLPVGFPMPWDHKEYNLVFRRLYTASPFFAYGHGLCHIMRSDSDMRDFFLRFSADRATQDVLPPMISKAKRALTSTIFIPGRVTHDLDPADVQPLLQGQLPASAVNMIEMFERSLDQDSISPVVAGQESSGSPTAYEISQQQKQAQRALGPIIFNFMWVLKDLDWLRCQNILENLARPKDKKIDPVTKELVNIYEKIIASDVDIKDGETGVHVVQFAKKDETPNSLDILAEEIKQKKEGRNMKFTYIDADFIREMRYSFINTVKSNPKKNSDVNKILFGDFLNSLTTLIGMGSVPSKDLLETKFARLWNEDPDKLFPEAPEQPTNGLGALLGGSGGTGAGAQIKQSATAGGLQDSSQAL